MHSKIKDCFKEGKNNGERHKGLREIEISEENVQGHLKKAVHNFNAILAFKEQGFSDWSASASFYCLYHCLLAILAKNGIESRNQSCTFAYIERLIEEKKISLTLEELKEIFDRDITEDLENSNKILDLREKMQYSISTSLKDKEFSLLLERTKYLFDKLRIEVER